MGKRPGRAGSGQGRLVLRGPVHHSKSGFRLNPGAPSFVRDDGVAYPRPGYATPMYKARHLSTVGKQPNSRLPRHSATATHADEVS